MNEAGREFVDSEAVAEALRFAEAEHQQLKAAIASAHGTADRIVRLGVAVMAGVVATSGIITTTDVTVSPVAMGLLILGGGLVVVSSMRLVGLVAGVPGPSVMRAGPSLERLIDALRIEHWNRAQIQWGVLMALRRDACRMQVVHARIDRGVAAGYVMLVAGVAIFLVGLGYILGGRM